MGSFPLRIAILYAVVSVAWIVGSDQVVDLMFPDSVTAAQTAKGWVFVLATTLLIYFLVREEFQRRNAAEEKLRRSETEFRQIVENMPDVFYRTDAEGRIVMFSPFITEATGYTSDELIGMNMADLYVDPEDRQKVMEALRANQGRATQVEAALRRKDGKVIWVSTNAYVRLDEDGNPLGVEGIARDITPRKEMEDRLRYLAGHDPLTGLPNRSAFNDRLAQAIARARRADTRVGLLFVDMDGFKDINDAFGHDNGDALLAAVAMRLRALLRETDTAARMGGDEFTVILEGNIDRESAAMVAEKLVATMAEPFVLDRGTVRMSASTGVAMYPDDALGPVDLLRQADQAMYRAKDLGRNRHQFWEAAE